MTILIVGGGKMGLSHLALASALVGRDNVAVCEASIPLRFAYRGLGCETFPSLSAAMHGLGRKLAGAIVATPTPSHFTVAKTLMLASVPCLIEKPLTLRSDRSSELVQIAASQSIPALVGFVLRYVATFVTLRKLILTNTLGPPLSYHARMAGNVISSSHGNSWRSDFTRGGGCLNEYGPHLIDLCRYIFGDISEIHEVTAGRVYSQRADDRLTASWKHESGTAGRMELDWCDSTLRKSIVQFEVVFRNARVTLDNSTLNVHHTDASAQHSSNIKKLEPGAPASVIFYLRGEEYSLQLEEFLGLCLGRNLGTTPFEGSATPALLADGLAVDRLIEILARKGGLA